MENKTKNMKLQIPNPAVGEFSNCLSPVQGLLKLKPEDRAERKLNGERNKPRTRRM